MDEKLKVQIEAETAGLGAGLNRAKGELDAFAAKVEAGPLGAVSNLRSGVLGLAAAIGGTLVFEGFKKAIAAAAEADTSIRQLASSVELAGGSIKRDGAAITATIKGLFNTTLYDDEDLQNALSNLITMTGDVAASLRALPIAADLAAKKNIDLQTATQILGLAAEGATRGLKQLGISFTEDQQKAFSLMTEVQRLQIVLGLVNERTSGAAKTNVESYGGALKQAGKDLHEVWEAVGTVIFQVTHAMDVFFLGWRQHVIDAQRETPSLIEAIQHALKGEFRATGDWTNAGGIRTGGHSTIVDTSIPSAAAARGILGMQTDLIGWNPGGENDKAAKQWKSDVDQLRESYLSLSKNLAIVTANFGDSRAAVQAYADDLVKVGDEADRLGVRLPAALRQAVIAARELKASLLGGLPQGQTLAEWMHAQTLTGIWSQSPALKIPITLVPKLEPTRMQEIAHELSNAFGQNFASAFGDIFEDLATTGGQNFGQIAAQFFKAQLHSAADAFGNWVIEILGGGKLEKNAQGEFVVGAQTFPNTPAGQAQARTAKGQGVYGQIGQGIGGAFGLYSSVANAGSQSDLSTVLTGTLGGAALGGAVGGLIAGGVAGSVVPVLGTVIGAAVGLIVGGIAAALSSVGKDYKFGQFGVKQGQAFFTPGQNITATEAQQAQQQIADTLATFSNGYIQVLMRFPREFREGLMAVVRNADSFFPRVGLEAGGDIGRAASAHFMEHFNDWVNGRLPRDIAATFFEPLAEAFQSQGLSTERFHAIWDELQQLDPKKALELLGALAEGLVSIHRNLERFAMPSGFRGRYDAMDTDTLRGYVASRDARSFAQTIADTDKEILDLADSLSLLTGEEQIRTVQRIGQLMDDRYAREEEYIRGLNRMLADANTQIDAAIRGYQLANIDDPQAQTDFLTSRYNDLTGQLAGAQTGEEAQRIYNEIFSIIGQIAQVGGAQSPTDQHAMNEWAQQALEQLRGSFSAVIGRIGAQLDVVNGDFSARIAPMLDGFTGVAQAAVDVNASFSNAAAAGDALADSMDRAVGSIERFIQSADSMDLFSARVRADRSAA